MQIGAQCVRLLHIATALERARLGLPDGAGGWKSTRKVPGEYSSTPNEESLFACAAARIYTYFYPYVHIYVYAYASCAGGAADEAVGFGCTVCTLWRRCARARVCAQVCLHVCVCLRMCFCLCVCLHSFSVEVGPAARPPGRGRRGGFFPSLFGPP